MNEGAASFLKSKHLQRTVCLVADMRMPGITGLELYRTLVAAGNRP
jgi:FixJ family two-component response regulator